MKTYIVHIYRQEPGRPGELIGDIEEAGIDEKKIFHTFDDLEKILKGEEKVLKPDGRTKRRVGARNNPS